MWHFLPFSSPLIWIPNSDPEDPWIRIRNTDWKVRVLCFAPPVPKGDRLILFYIIHYFWFNFMRSELDLDLFFTAPAKKGGSTTLLGMLRQNVLRFPIPESCFVMFGFLRRTASELFFFCSSLCLTFELGVHCGSLMEGSVSGVCHEIFLLYFVWFESMWAPDTKPILCFYSGFAEILDFLSYSISHLGVMPEVCIPPRIKPLCLYHTA